MVIKSEQVPFLSLCIWDCADGTELVLVAKVLIHCLFMSFQWQLCYDDVSCLSICVSAVHVYNCGITICFESTVNSYFVCYRVIVSCRWPVLPIAVVSHFCSHSWLPSLHHRPTILFCDVDKHVQMCWPRSSYGVRFDSTVVGRDFWWLDQSSLHSLAMLFQYRKNR